MKLNEISNKIISAKNTLVKLVNDIYCPNKIAKILIFNRKICQLLIKSASI